MVTKEHPLSFSCIVQRLQVAFPLISYAVSIYRFRSNEETAAVSTKTLKTLLLELRLERERKKENK